MGDSTSSQHLVGTVEKFDQSSKELTLANSSKKLKISDDTKVMKDGQQASISDIQEGDQIRASFSGSGDTLQVNRLEVMSAGTTGTKSHGMGSPSGTSSGSSTGSSSTGSSSTGDTAGSSSGTTGSGTTSPGSSGSSTDTGTTGSGTGKRY